VGYSISKAGLRHPSAAIPASIRLKYIAERGARKMCARHLCAVFHDGRSEMRAARFNFLRYLILRYNDRHFCETSLILVSIASDITICLVNYYEAKSYL